MGVECLVGHKLVDQQPLVGVDAVPNQRDKVPVVHAADDLDLRPELAVPLPALRLELLDRHLGAVQRPPVHAPEAALPDDVAGGEPVRRGRELLVRVGTAAGRQLGDDVDGMVAVGSGVRERAAGLGRRGALLLREVELRWRRLLKHWPCRAV